MDQNKSHWDCIIVGTGPAGLGVAFTLMEENKNLKILMIDRENYSTGGLRNDCKMNFTYPVGFPEEYWTREEADIHLSYLERFLSPAMMDKKNLEIYQKRAARLDSELLNIRQAHLGTDGGQIGRAHV